MTTTFLILTLLACVVMILTQHKVTKRQNKEIIDLKANAINKVWYELNLDINVGQDKALKHKINNNRINELLNYNI